MEMDYKMFDKIKERFNFILPATNSSAGISFQCGNRV